MSPASFAPNRVVVIVVILNLLPTGLWASSIPRCARPDDFQVSMGRTLGPFPDLGRDQLVYNGFAIRATTTEPGLEWLERVRVEMDGRLLLWWPDSGLSDRGSTRFGLLPLLGSDQQLLVLHHFSGGAHCCHYLRVHLLEPEFKVIFDSSEYVASDAHGEFAVCDLDSDGTAEIILNSSAFAYFGPLPHVLSPYPPVVFKYDSSQSAFLPANRVFPRVSKGDESKLLDQVINLNGELYPDALLSAVLRLMLLHLYAGEESEAWEVFNAHYTLADKKQVREAIETTLRKDRLYQAVHSAGAKGKSP